MNTHEYVSFHGIVLLSPADKILHASQLPLFYEIFGSHGSKHD
jgi:hypothetical protein